MKRLLFILLSVLTIFSVKSQNTLTLQQKDSIILPNGQLAVKDTSNHANVFRVGETFSIDSIVLGEDVNKNQSMDYLIVCLKDTTMRFRCAMTVNSSQGLDSVIIGGSDTVVLKWPKDEWFTWTIVGGVPKQPEGTSAEIEKGKDYLLTYIALIALFVLLTLVCWFLWRRNRKRIYNHDLILSDSIEELCGKTFTLLGTPSVLMRKSKHFIPAIKFGKITLFDKKETTPETTEEKLNRDITAHKLRFEGGIEMSLSLVEPTVSQDGKKQTVTFKVKTEEEISTITPAKGTLTVSYNDGKLTEIWPIVLTGVSKAVEDERKEADSKLKAFLEQLKKELKASDSTEDAVVSAIAGLKSSLQKNEEKLHETIEELQNTTKEKEETIESLAKSLGIPKEKLVGMATIRDWTFITQRPTKIVHEIVQQNPSLSKFWEDDIKRFLDLLSKRLINDKTTFDQILEKLNQDQLFQLKSYMRNELVKKGITPGNSNKRFDDFVDCLKTQLLQQPKQITIPATISEEQKEEIKDEAFRTMLINLNEKAAPKKVEVESVREFVSEMARLLNMPSTAEEVRLQAETLASEKVNKAEEDKDNAVRAKEEAENTLKQKQVEFEAEKKQLQQEKETALSTLRTQLEEEKANLQTQLDDEKKNLQSVKDTNEQFVTELKQKHTDELKQKQDEFETEKQQLQHAKETALSAQKIKMEAEKTALQFRLEGEKKKVIEELEIEQNAHNNDLQKLEAYLNMYVANIRDTFAQVNDFVKQANRGKDEILKKLIDKDIVDNRIYSLEYFDEKLKGVLEDAKNDKNGIKPVCDVRNSIFEVFENCLSEDDPTWIDVLARLYCYTQVGFLCDEFTQKGLDINKVVTAFQATQVLLRMLGIDIIYPELFKDEFDKAKFDHKAGLNITGYLPDIEQKIKDNVAENTDLIVDLRTVGYKVGDEVKEKPIVAKFY